MSRLFVYGIFLDAGNRERYGMTNPKYATVKDYATFGDWIVAAWHIPNKGLALTGLVVDMDDNRWEPLDRLEGGYDRVTIETVQGDQAFMYVGKDW